MDEETLRKMAIAQYLQGKPPRSIYGEMERSKKWFFKWLLRYRSGTPEWYRDQPKRPRHHPNQVSSETQSLIKQVRCHLEQNRHAQTGVSAIKWEFIKLGATAPSDRTINRILKRDGLVKKNGLRSQRARVPLFHPGTRSQQHPPSRSGGPTLHQKQRPLLLAQYLRPLQPPGLYSSSTHQGRPSRRRWPTGMLANDGNARLSPSRQPTQFSWKQPLSSLFRDCLETLSHPRDRGGLHSSRGTLAQWRRGALQ